MAVRFEEVNAAEEIAVGQVIIDLMLSRYIHEAMKRTRYKALPDKTYFGQIPGIAGVWASG